MNNLTNNDIRNQQAQQIVEKMKMLSKCRRQWCGLEQNQHPYHPRNRPHFSGTVNTLIKPKPTKNVINLDYDDYEDDTLLDPPAKLLNFRVDYGKTPVPNYVAARINPWYLSLIKQGYKKDCRTWLHKNSATKAKVLAIHIEIQRCMLFSMKKGGN